MNPHRRMGGRFGIWYVKFTDPESGCHVLCDLTHFEDEDCCRIALKDAQGGGCVAAERYASGFLQASCDPFDVRREGTSLTVPLPKGPPGTIRRHPAIFPSSRARWASTPIRP